MVDAHDLRRGGEIGAHVLIAGEGSGQREIDIAVGALDDTFDLTAFVSNPLLDGIRRRIDDDQTVAASGKELAAGEDHAGLDGPFGGERPESTLHRGAHLDGTVAQRQRADARRGLHARLGILHIGLRRTDDHQMLRPCILALGSFDNQRIGILHAHRPGVADDEPSGPVHRTAVLRKQVNPIVGHEHILHDIADLLAAVGLLEHLLVLLAGLVVPAQHAVGRGHVALADDERASGVREIHRSAHLGRSEHRLARGADTDQRDDAAGIRNAIRSGRSLQRDAPASQIERCRPPFGDVHEIGLGHVGHTQRQRPPLPETEHEATAAVLRLHETEHGPGLRYDDRLPVGQFENDLGLPVGHRPEEGVAVLARGFDLLARSVLYTHAVNGPVPLGIHRQLGRLARYGNPVPLVVRQEITLAAEGPIVNALDAVDTDDRGVCPVGDRHRSLVAEDDRAPLVGLDDLRDRLVLLQRIDDRPQRGDLLVERRQFVPDPVDFRPKVVVVIRTAPRRHAEHGEHQKCNQFSHSFRFLSLTYPIKNQPHPPGRIRRKIQNGHSHTSEISRFATGTGRTAGGKSLF